MPHPEHITPAGPVPAAKAKKQGGSGSINGRVEDEMRHDQEVAAWFATLPAL
jgi:hypothetical protein